MENLKKERKMENKILNDFIKYCKEFYHGENAVYPLKNVSHIDIVHACNLVSRRNDIEFLGDSSDRELVRHLLHTLGFKQAN
jgi:hypothetical protein